MNREFYKKLLSLVLPIAFSQFMLSLVGASDAVMLGMISQDALSAVSLAGQVTFVFNLFLTALCAGASMMAAQYWGTGDRSAVEKILAFVLRASLLVSCVFFAGSFFLPQTLMRFFTPEAALIAGGSVYLKASSVSYLFCGVSQIYLYEKQRPRRKKHCDKFLRRPVKYLIKCAFYFRAWRHKTYGHCRSRPGNFGRKGCGMCMDGYRFQESRADTAEPVLFFA